MSLLVTAGGTGGHISPGIAIASELRAQGAIVSFLSLEKNRNYADFQNTDYPVYFYNAPALKKNPAMFLFPFRLLGSIFQVIRIMKHEKVKAVIAMGGYPVFPAILAAILTRRPFYLFEQNAAPGRVTRLFSRFSRRIFLTFPDLTEKIKIRPELVYLTGNPMRKPILKVLNSQPAEKRARPLKRDGSLNILILGGSQGARQINEMIAASIDVFPNFHWIWQCGENHIESIRKELSESQLKRVELFGFHSQIHELYRKADLIVCRAGAGVVTEACGFGLAMVLIPYPYAMDNHQLYNAKFLKEAGAAHVIYRTDSDPKMLQAALKKLGHDIEKRERMHRAARSAARLNAAEKSVRMILADLSEDFKKLTQKSKK